ncbi:expressed unknown protein [Seminavis robusta]|uniref:Uncharacterized protein n=1 Tax=Seminavis robusta TaxID=568900 RepID=A0A9N8DT42_9STRA|nr:expressed unknown protein [Seminavis robusta]|eukprot:Sro259_g101260.1 n/a (513) ;mRNA; r:13972-15785
MSFLPTITPSLTSSLIERKNQLKGFMETSASLPSLSDMNPLRGLMAFEKGSLGAYQDPKEANIFCSDMVGCPFILRKLKEVRDNLKICRLEIEDLLEAGTHHHVLLPVIKSLVLLDCREWDHVHFIDSFPLDHYQSWKEGKDNLMQDYEATAIDSGLRVDRCCILWKATIEIRSETGVEDILELFKALKNDTSVIHTSFRGDAFGVKGTPEALASLIEWRDGDYGSISKTAFVDVQCGWSDDGHVQNVLFLNTCMYVLKHPQRDTGAPAARGIKPSRSIRVPRRQRINSLVLPEPPSRPALRRHQSACFGRVGQDEETCKAADLMTRKTLTRTKSASSAGQPGKRAVSNGLVDLQNASGIARKTPTRAKSASTSRRKAQTTPRSKSEIIPRRKSDTRLLVEKKTKEDVAPRSKSDARLYGMRRTDSTKRTEHSLKNATFDASGSSSRRPPSRSKSHSIERERGQAKMLRTKTVEGSGSNISVLFAAKKRLEDTPDYDWELGAFLNRQASKAA